jgi:hypothetical protein
MNQKQIKFLKEVLSSEDFEHLMSLNVKLPQVEKKPCTAITKKKDPCKNKAITRGLCTRHCEKIVELMVEVEDIAV